jgi:tetratricopeptide (TPR) repeat protein
MSANAFDKKLNDARGFLTKAKFADAFLRYQALTAQFPGKVQAWFEFGMAAGGAGKIEIADQAWKKAIQLDPQNSHLRLLVGHQYQNVRLMQQAREAFEQSAALDPRAIDPRMAVAMLLEGEHQFDAARDVIASCLAINPRDDQARYFQALLDRRQNKLDDAERRLRDLIASQPQHQYVQYASRYELAEVMDRTGRYDEAIALLTEAKGILRRLAPVDTMLKEYGQEAGQYRRTTMELPRDILRTWNREFPAAERQEVPSLAFLGGHPRSGTTLLEQILGAHPNVAALDESRTFTMVVCQLFNASPQVPPARLNVMRRQYMEAIQKEWGGDLHGKLLLDKNPSPTAKLRIWLRVFPELRVIIALRDPRDVVLSCYFLNVPLNPFNANFLSLEQTARHYANIMDVWLAVRQWEGLSAVETRYEDVVADLEKEGRRVTQFLGLDWDPSQAQFHEKSSKKKMFSPTYHDASQPVYARAVARWHSYEKHLAPILPILEPYCRAFGYA